MSFFFVQASPELATEDMRAVLRLPAGRRVLRRLLGAAGVMSTSQTAPEFGISLAMNIESVEPGAVSRLMLESSNERPAKKAKTKGESDGD